MRTPATQQMTPEQHYLDALLMFYQLNEDAISLGDPDAYLGEEWIHDTNSTIWVRVQNLTAVNHHRATINAKLRVVNATNRSADLCVPRGQHCRYDSITQSIQPVPLVRVATEVI